ncbi:MAG: hypothetical protein IEMM0002_1393 [bacterium]|nr:MAG: hypothetical protein IEMM0002_1393 [bacterium]
MELNPELLFNVFHRFAGLAVPVCSEDILHSLRETLGNHMDEAESAVAGKTKQTFALATVVIVPVAVLAGIFLLGIAYNIFTGAADRVGHGITLTVQKLKKLTSAIWEKSQKDDDPAAFND